MANWSAAVITANSKIFVRSATPAGVQGFLSVPTVVAGTSFSIQSVAATETSIVYWWIVN